MNEEEKQAIEYIKKELEDEKKHHNRIYKGILGLYDNGSIETILNLIDKQSKEIEELKEDNNALEMMIDTANEREYRKKYIEERRKEQPNLYYPDFDEIYERYYKQKAEIEQLKEDYQILKDDIEGHNIVYVDTPEFEEKYISKDKIRELKEKVEKDNKRLDRENQLIFETKLEKKDIKGWQLIEEYDTKEYDWVLIKYFDGDFECVPCVAEKRYDDKWYDRNGDLIPFEVKYFFDMQQLDLGE